MRHYVLPTPRAALGLAAAAVTAVIIGVAVVAPARLSTSITPQQVEVVVIPAIEIVGTRDSNIVSARGSEMVRARSKEQI